jgi:hypothetical protein
MTCILSAFLRYNVFFRQVDDSVFRFDHGYSGHNPTNFPRGLQRKSDKLEMSKMFYFIYLMFMKSGIEYFVDSFNRSEVIIVVQYQEI